MQKIIAAAATAVLLAFLAPGASGLVLDDPQVGFVLDELPYPGASATATLADGRIVAFDGTSIDLYDADGQWLGNLGALPAFAFPSFVIVDMAETTVVFGESSNGIVYELGLSPGTPAAVTTLAFNYDAVFEDATNVIVSSAAGGFGSTQIHRVDLVADSATLLAEVAGASGPVALDGFGNLYYGTSSNQFPAPPGSSDVLRWSAAQLTGSPVLTESDASVVATGFDGAADLAIDPIGGGIYLAENNFGSGVNRIWKISGHATLAPLLVDGSTGLSISNLEFLPGDGAAAFTGYQPPTGGTLIFNSTDFASVFERKALHALRPESLASGPGTTGPGLFDLDVAMGPPNGFGLVIYGNAALFHADEVVLSKYRVPLFFGVDIPTHFRAPGSIPLDGTGRGAITYDNPDGLSGFALQVILFDASGKLAGTTTTAFL